MCDRAQDTRPLVEKSTAERTEDELQLAFDLYISSKTVNGRFCPTPDLYRSDGELSWTDEEWQDDDNRPAPHTTASAIRGG